MNNSVVSEPFDYLYLSQQFPDRGSRVSESRPSYTQSMVRRFGFCMQHLLRLHMLIPVQDADVQQYDSCRNHWPQAPAIIGEAFTIPLKVPRTTSKPRKDEHPSNTGTFGQPYWWKDIVTEVTPEISSVSANGPCSPACSRILG